MSETNGFSAQQQQTQRFQCSGNCLSCSPAQRAYCASQHAYSNMKVLDKMMSEILELHDSIKNLSEKIEAIQSNEARVFDPAACAIREAAQTIDSPNN